MSSFKKEGEEILLSERWSPSMTSGKKKDLLLAGKGRLKGENAST